MSLENEKIKLEDGSELYLNSPKLKKCHVTGKHINTDNAIKLAYIIRLDAVTGLRDVDEWKWVCSNKYISYRNLCWKLVTQGGNFVLTHDYIVNPLSTGKVHPNPMQHRGLWDDAVNNSKNRGDQFRSFNNMVKAFKGYDNPSISEEDKKLLLERDYHFGVRTLTNKIFEGLGYTYGVELETSSGRITEEEAEGLNMRCEFDGSLRDTPDQKKEDVLGGEYVTGVLIGDAGMFQLQNICNALSKKCTINNKCGVHVHVGGLTFSKENIVYMYMLGTMLQNEFFELLPKSRKTNAYCRLIKDLNLNPMVLAGAKTPLLYKVTIDEYFNKIFKEVSHGGTPSKKSNKLKNHPLGSKCGYDKASQRYCWLNFVTAMFDTKGNTNAYTLEFRSHSATLNYEKVKNWVKICMAFANFAENHQSSIARGYWLDKCGDRHAINLRTIIRASYPRTNSLLMQYVDERKHKFSRDNGVAEATEYIKEEGDFINLSKTACVL